MLLSSACLIWCPTPQGKQGQFALKQPVYTVKKPKITRNWTERPVSRRELVFAGASAGLGLNPATGSLSSIPGATKETDFVLSPAFFAGLERASRHDSLVAEIVPTGGRSSMVELQIVVLAVAGSSPVGRPLFYL
jgi:hypothetical protein